MYYRFITCNIPIGLIELRQDSFRNVFSSLLDIRDALQFPTKFNFSKAIARQSHLRLCRCCQYGYPSVYWRMATTNFNPLTKDLRNGSVVFLNTGS